MTDSTNGPFGNHGWDDDQYDDRQAWQRGQDAPYGGPQRGQYGDGYHGGDPYDRSHGDPYDGQYEYGQYADNRYQDEPYSDEEYGGRAGGGGGRGGRRRRRRRLRRRWLALIGSAVVLVLVFGVLGAVYAAARIPLPGEVVNPQTSVLTYADGKTPLARVFAENRTEVHLAQVPVPVQRAVLAAENRDYYRDPGFDLKGIARALWNNVRGNDTQGGSTITQQYVKNAYLTQERTYSRKLKELVISIKLDRQYTKNQILEWYLNTIYFGRGAYGIEAASETYFGVPVGKLSVAQGAVLASSIRSPAGYDPQSHLDRAKARWNFVLDGMVSEHWLSPSARAAAVYPKVLPRNTGPNSQLTGPKGYIVQQVKEELDRIGIDEGELNRAGLRVQTTVDKSAQDAAVAAVNKVFAGQPKNLRQALVAVDPHSGGVLAYYGGSSGVGFDYAQAWRAPGSSFKPYVLATGLEQSIKGQALDKAGKLSVYTRFDGTSPRDFAGVTVHNSGNEQCPKCTVMTAMKESINTVFYDMATQAGPDNVAALAHRMGIPTKRSDNDKPTLQVDGVTDGSIGIGRYEVRPIDQATGFATFASGGVRHSTHFVQKVIDPKGNVLYDASKDSPNPPKRVLDPQVANDVAFSMEPVAEWSHDSLADDRQSASKTGTQQLGETPDNQDAWMVGFTPQVSASVWVGTDRNEPLRNAAGRIIFGAGLPGQTWKAFMDAWLSDKSQLDLPDKAEIVGDAAQSPEESDSATPSPTPSATPSPTPTRTTPPPTPTQKPKPVQTLPVPPQPTVPFPVPSPSDTPTPSSTAKPTRGGGGVG